MSERLFKLLETATHPSTGDAERGNAINLFRKLADGSGSIRNAFGAVLPTPNVSGDAAHWQKMWSNTRYLYKKTNERLEVAESELAICSRDRDRVAGERDAAIQRYYKLRTALSHIIVDGDDLNDPAVALHGALTTDWLTITDLVRTANRNGFTGSDATIRNRADALAKKGIIEVRRNEPRAWRHKQ